MTAGGTLVLGLLALLAACTLQALAAEDLYWEGEEDASNEFLEVKHEDTGIGGHLRRLKRDWNDWTSFLLGSSSTTTTENYESLTEDPSSVDEAREDKDDDDLEREGSGLPGRDTEPREKTLRVNFVVIQPYRMEYSNRDSHEFLTFSRSLTDAVNLLYDSLPGTQRASLVRIQSVSDEFTCKVTLDIVTTGYEDTQRITDILRDHIRNRRKLGSVAVNDSNFSAAVIDPGSPIEQCKSDEFHCADGFCVPRTAWCNSVPECPDGSDEVGCPSDWTNNRVEQTPDEKESNGEDSLPPVLPTLAPTDWVPWGTPERGDNNSFDKSPDEDKDLSETTPRPDSTFSWFAGGSDDNNGLDQTTTSNENFPETTISLEPTKTCHDDEMQCDTTRCVPLSKRCDNIPHCFDGKDEEGCDKSCGSDDFRCNSGLCIPKSRQCNRLVDCPGGEDEQNCECTPDEFRCESDGICIENRKQCDGVSHCSDNSDEANCRLPQVCPAGSFTCNAQSTVQCATRCDGRRECDEGEDEENCPDTQECHECDGKCLEDRQICDQVADCSDGSDELFCGTCDGPNDYRCRNGECINAVGRCNKVPECSDMSDELDCNDTMISSPQGCLDNQFGCRDGTCINREFVCDSHRDCIDGSDEENCQCEEGNWRCVSGQCIPNAARCDEIADCTDSTDEMNCPVDDRWYTTTYSNIDLPPYQPPTTSRPIYTTTSFPYGGYDNELYPPSGGQGPIALRLKTYPNEQTVRNAQVGGDVVFQCRDEGPYRVPVRWVRDGGRPLKPGSSDRNGRLEMNQVSVSDGGVYICQAPRYLGTPGSEIRVQLTVDNPSTTRRPPQGCLSYQATCGNGQCISKSAVCDGKKDCLDGSDEDTCNQNGMCEPNQFQCANRKCVLKTWLCDSEDDCGDGSDEQNCEAHDPSQLCLPVEFTCTSGSQCVPKSFHCDGQTDCFDGSDEIGCAPVHVSKPPYPSYIRLNPGETLTLVCEAVGVPTPLISWRLNWGHVPPKCTATTENGVGTLNCPNIQPEDSGAYSCEAMNNKLTVFAVPDSIVFVNKTDVCPNGYFNSEARSERECIRCFCFGESTVCKSADLFTSAMPTPFGQGGTRLVGVKQTYDGDYVLDTQPVTDQYYYQPLRNGATVTKLANYVSSWSQGSNARPYLTLPETYNGNQLTSYGGHIKYNLSPHSPRYYQEDNMPDVIIKGKYQNLVHRSDKSQGTYINVRLTPENWQKTSSRGLTPATREDIMMALDNIEMIMLRADHNSAGVNITDFSMESARDINVGLGVASLVEECTCPPGYEGLSCQKCAAGYVREKSGPWLGNCVRQAECPPGTYGDPSSGYGCRPCPCPHANRENQFARTCSLGPRGSVVCDCEPGYGGNNCEYCEEGYVGNPLMPGDYCKRAPSTNCNPIGTVRTLLPDECQCKDNVQGKYCDQCKNESFYLSEDFSHGCALCFCTGVSQECRSSNLRRKTISVRFNTPQIVQQVAIYTSAPVGNGAVKYNAPVETDIKPQFYRGELSLSTVDRSRPTIYYWSLPANFAGDKVTSYGGYLRYTLRNIPIGLTSKNNAADVLLISDNRLTFHYFGNFAPSDDATLNASIQFLEKGWQRPDGKEISREHFLLALADVKAILIKASYSTNTPEASLESASIDIAEPNGNGPQALHVEQCVCPPEYHGTSCEDCAPGYTRISSGIYLEHCGPCNCSKHSNMCHPETGVCYDCKDNTEGDYCERCKPGYIMNRHGYCVFNGNYDTTKTPTCRCDSRGSLGACDEYDNCQCKQNVEGANCDRCRAGTFDLDDKNPFGCRDCYCSGATQECHEASHYTRIPLPAPIFGEHYGGYTLTDLNAEEVINDHFNPDPNASELKYTFSEPVYKQYYWSLPVFPGNRVLSYGGTLALTQRFETGPIPATSSPDIDVVLVGDSLSIYWNNPTPIHSEVALSYQVPLQEGEWFILNTAVPASRQDFMSVLKNLRRVLVRATLVPNIISTAIADVSMDTATDSYSPGFPTAKGVEVCMCPEGYSGTSCESCIPGWYKDENNLCRQCNCNGHDCQLNRYNEVICNCQPPYRGPDCTTIGESSIIENTTRPPPAEPTVVVRIINQAIDIYEVGSSVNFTCQALSRITRRRLPVTWTKADGYLPQGRSQVDSRSGLLLITNLQVSDSGKYICQTNDGITTAQATATVNVPGNEMTLPTVTIQPAASEHYEGERIELQCVTSGNPAPSISWQRVSNRPLPQTAETYDGYFIIENAREEDSGEYRCIATNAVGYTDRTAIVTVRPKQPSPTRGRLTVSTTSPTVSEGQSTRVVCTGTTNIPAGSIHWIRQDQAAFLSNVRSENGVLYLDYAQPDNQGIYICQTASVDVAPVLVLVSVIPTNSQQISDSNITVNVDHVSIPTGGSGSVDCNPQGYPLPLIKWKKYNEEFGPGVSQRGNSLLISNAQESDQGYYICEGSVNGSPIDTNIYVYVEIEKREKPRVEIWPQGEQRVSLGNQFELHCRVLGGVPEPEVMWSRSSGRQLSSYAQLRSNNILRFENIEVNDEGEYICTATNIAGTDSASSVIKVRSLPEIMIKPNNYVQAVRGDPLNIECRARGYPEPMVSIKTSPDLRELVPATQGTAVLRLSSVSDRDEGNYVCEATSDAGTVNEPFVVQVERGDGGGFGDVGSGSGPDPDIQNPYEEPSSLIAFEGEDTTIECTTAEGGENFEVEWHRTDRPLQSNARQVGSTLYIYNASKSDSGDYSCNAINTYTREAQQAGFTRLLVVTAPKITLKPKRQTVRPGQSPTVECIVEGDDLIDITWRPVNVPQSSRVEIRHSILIFHQIEVSDAGQYECLARNSYGNASATAEVIVSEETGREMWESHEHEQFAHIGAAVHLSCNVTQPNLKIWWSKNGKQIPYSVRQQSDGSLFIRLAQRSDSGTYVCHIQDEYRRRTSNYINLHIEGPPDESPALVSIEQPRRPFRVGETVEVLCTVNSRGAQANWERYGNNQQQQYVEARDFGGGSSLIIRDVEESDAGVYRCVGQDPYGHTSYEDFNLEVIPVVAPSRPDNENDVYTARLGDYIDLPCNIEQPTSVEWKREYTPLSADIRANELHLRLERVTEADAGTYVCRSTDGVPAESRAILRVEGIVPRFEGDSWVSLPTIKDAYRQFDIEISFKPSDNNGLILYNSEAPDYTGDYLALYLKDGLPHFDLRSSAVAGPVSVTGDRPLQLNTWHTIRISKTNSKVTMDVDNTGPFSTPTSGQWDILDLNQPLYIGGVPEPDQLQSQLPGVSGFMGCVSMLILGREETNILMNSTSRQNIRECDSCTPNLCLNNGVCQEARNERGYMCFCPAGFAGLNCDRTGEACRAGLCGPGKCTDTADGYKCACPITYTGRNCDVKQSIEYPAFTGSAYLAIKVGGNDPSRLFRMSMKIKATSPVTDGIIMYCAKSARGYGGFTSLAVHNGKLEFRYDLGDGTPPVVLTANKTLPANEWTDVHIARIGGIVSLKINLIHEYEKKLASPKKDLYLETPMFVGGVDDSIVLNNNTGVFGGFNGCIKDVMVHGENVNLVNSSIQSSNVQECSNYDRGDIPEIDSPCSQCRNGGYCTSAESTACTCPTGYTGTYCENRAYVPRTYENVCAPRPCRNGGTCRPDYTTKMNYTCDCPLGFSGTNCQITLELFQSVGFAGNGYLELPSALLRYDNLDRESVVIALAFNTMSDGVLLYQREALDASNYGDYILLRVDQGRVVFDWDFGSGSASISIDEKFVNDGERHAVIAKLNSDSTVYLSVDHDHSKTRITTGFANRMHANSNIYIGGIPDRFNEMRYPGLTGCIEQVELMGTRDVQLGTAAIASRNARRCKDSRF